MIKITDSTVFNTAAECIVNTINCVGFMGKGIALEFALRYPKLEKQYVEECHKKQIHTGRVYFYNIDGQKIINFPTKFHFKNPSRLEWIEEGLWHFIENYKNWNIKSIAFPILGSNNGGLNPKVVEDIMIKYLGNLDIDVYICHSRLVEGKELEMVEAFKRAAIQDMKTCVRLNVNQIISLQHEQYKIKRFSDLLKIKGIGIDTYKSLFRLFYNSDFCKSEQLSLF